jgi:ankyrin repeat protein
MPAEKVNCVSCNAEIMQITADLNAGKCAPCADKSGGSTKFRYWKNITASGEKDPSEFQKLDRHGLGALHWAVENGDQMLFQRALEAGVPVDQLTAHGELSPLHFSAMQENAYFLEMLIDRGALLDQRDRKRSTPLHYVAEFGLVGHARKLIEAGCCQKPFDKCKQSPFDVAFRNGRIEMIEYLANLPAARHRSWSARLPFAVERGLPKVVKWLLDRGANPKTRRDPYRRTVFEIARKPFRAKDYKLDGYTEEEIELLFDNHRQVIALVEDAIKRAK